MSRLRVRAYNVRFGDAVLVSVPDRSKGRTITRHILVDVGNVLSTEGGIDTVFEPAIRNIMHVLDGRPLDLYVMTHEHMDHVQGLLFASERLGLRFEVDYAWLTASAHPDYYKKFPKAGKRRMAMQAAFNEISRFYGAAPERRSPLVDALLLNNDYQSTTRCLAYLRDLARRTTYVYRGRDLRGSHPFSEAKLRVWAPEEDTTAYYGSYQPMALGVVGGAEGDSPAVLSAPTPPAGVDAGAFYHLVEIRRNGHTDNLLAIDRANNNSSVVFCLEWRGWKLLFPGDAEHRSWKEMDKAEMLEPVHFVKVAHHGSSNGTPSPELLEKILPASAPDRRSRRALLSTCAGTYFGVPDKKTIKQLRARCKVFSVGEASEPSFVDIEFEAD